jgi:hypothetical protein
LIGVNNVKPMDVTYYGAKMGCQDPDEYPGNTAYWFFAFFGLMEGSRNKN